MQKTITKPLSILLGFILLFGALCLTGCSSGASSSTNNPSSAEFKPNKDEIKIDQIDWSVENAVMDGYRRIAFTYTNNSQFDIVDLDFKFSMKPDVTPEVLRQACEALKDNGWTEENLNELSDATQEEVSRFSISAEWGQEVKSGASSGKDAMTMGFAFINAMEQYDLTEPNLLTIKYIAGDGKLYEETYDFKSKSYSLSDEVIDTKQWSDSELASQLPRPENLLVINIDDSEKRFTFETAGTDEDEFESYVSACKEAGFTKDVTNGSQYFYATSSDGKYDLDLFYYPDAGSITAYLDIASS